MIYKISIACDYGVTLKSKWSRIIEFPDDTSLYDLHLKIINLIDFDHNHLFGFYLSNGQLRSRKDWLSLHDDPKDRELEYLEMKLSDIFPLGRKKLFYIFDFGDQWEFIISRQSKYKAKEINDFYPNLIESIGENPSQYGY